MIELPSFVCEEDLEWLIEEVDPDWKDHFFSVDQAVEWYQDSRAMDEALAQLARDKLAEAQRIEWMMQDQDDEWIEQEVSENAS